MNTAFYGVIDVGSNSVRLMLSDGVKTFQKTAVITKLAEGLGVNQTVLKQDAVVRTAQAVYNLYRQAIDAGANKIYIFGTAAVRKASNKEVFIEAVKDLTGLTIDVISGELEAQLGYMGALEGKDGAVLDIGGASTEITIVKNSEKIFSKSVDIGVVRLYDACQDNILLLDEFIEEKLEEFGDIGITNLYGIGGTATSLAAIMQKLSPYDPSKTHGYQIDIKSMKKYALKLLKMPIKKRGKLKGLQRGREQVISGGAYLTYKIMSAFNVESLTVSERDNLEGYLEYVLEK